MHGRSHELRKQVGETMETKSQVWVDHPRGRNTHAQHQEELNIDAKTINCWSMTWNAVTCPWKIHGGPMQ